MRKVHIALLLFFAATAYSQEYPNLDHLMTQRIIDCSEIELNSKTLIPGYYRKGEIDSVKLVVEYWEGKCGWTEPAQRVRVLLALGEHNFQDLDQRDLFAALRAYQHRFDYVSYPFPDFAPRSLERAIEVHKSFDLFTSNLAFEAQSKYSPNSLEHLVCLFYQDNYEPLYASLNGPHSETTLAAEYEAEVRRADRASDAHVALFTGIWMPKERLSLMGDHPMVGASLGWTRKRITVDATVGFSFLKARHEYTLLDKAGDSYTSQRFTGFLASIEPSWALTLSPNQSALYLTAGIGYESITMYGVDEEEEQPGVYVGTFSATGGIGYRHFIHDNRGPYIGAQLRYHFLNLKPRGGTNLDGDALSVRLILGGISRTRSETLKQLYYGE